MMIDRDIEDLKLLKKAISEAEERLRCAKEAFVADHSKIKVGDIVPVNTGYSHVGKEILVDCVFFGWNKYKAGVGIVATGRLLKNDGTAGAPIGYHLELEVKL